MEGAHDAVIGQEMTQSAEEGPRVLQDDNGDELRKAGLFIASKHALVSVSIPDVPQREPNKPGDIYGGAIACRPGPLT